LVRLWFSLCIGVVCLFASPAKAVLNADLLNQSKTVTGAQWIGLHLRLLGLELTYPAYRVHLVIDEEREAIKFDFWISSPLSRHLYDAGRRETQRVLSYHAGGIRDQLQEMLDQHFPDVAGDFDAEVDLIGTFYSPAEQVQAPPVPWANWEKNELSWASEE
jgi:hypothetical protein